MQAGRGASHVIGIDLGTTHTVVAAASAHEAPEIVAIDQLVSRSEKAGRELYPSCLYAPTEDEIGEDPWNEKPWISGEFAQKRGAEVPGRVVASAKSWLCYRSVDRQSAILPWGAAEGVPRISPIDASALLLNHVRQVIESTFAPAKIEDHAIVLTIPASFDEVARELTLQAAERAGMSVKLLEEPQAAFYDYMHRAGARATLDLAKRHGGRATVLVCDVGGGTTDLSLLQIEANGDGDSHGEPRIERVAVGHHLLLGGDNMDLALALTGEARIGRKLDSAELAQLVARARSAKERLLSEPGLNEVAIQLLGRGAQLIGGGARVELTRHDVEELVLEGFFPLANRDARPERTRSGLVAFGLPYEKDVAITRHLAWFFSRHAPNQAAPDAVLLNGGVFRAKAIRDRILSILRSWTDTGTIELLEHNEPELGVARGAVAYGLALQGYGAKIESGAARGFYVGIESAGDKRRAICVVPRGAKESVPQVAASRPLALVVGRPVRFDLFASDDARVDAPGDVIEIDEERFESLPPIAVRFDAEQKKARATGEEIPIVLQGELTPIGTLELCCVENSPKQAQEPRRFRLVFQVRSGQSDAPPSGEPVRKSAPVVHPRLDQARERIEKAFSRSETASDRDVKDLLRDLDRLLGERSDWPLPIARALFDSLWPLHSSRRKSPDHERVFWLLAGFCLRPGFGDPMDPLRCNQFARLFPERVAFPDQVRNWQQFFIAWRRAAGGLDETTQLVIRDNVDPFLASADAGLKKPKKFKPESPDDMLDMASSLERVPAERRAELGGWILERTWTDQDPRLWAAIGRLGARVPTYASVHHVVTPRTAERWIEQLLREKWDRSPILAQAGVQLARMSGDRARDIGDRLRKEVEKKLTEVNARPDWIEAVRNYTPVEEKDRAAFFGESLPAGLRLIELG